MPVGLLQIDTQRDIVYNNARLLDILYGDEPLAPAVLLDAAPEVTVEEPASAAGTLLKTLAPDSLTSFEAVLDDVLKEGSDRDLEVDIELPSGAWRPGLDEHTGAAAEHR